ncbi:MAG: low specificity L-threonine aldolase [Opitutales bacterium]
MNDQFASDNTSGICPEAWAALAEANHGCLPSYGDDAWTEQASTLLREVFETDCDIYFVFNGTAANSLALASLCQSYHSVICHDQAHIERDECGAPEFFSNGTKLLLAGGDAGRLAPDAVEELIHRRKDIHYPKPRVLSLTQSTELGAVYTVEEIRELTAIVKGNGLCVHMDGARFANAAASLQLPPKEYTWKAGVDVLCFGGTKNGMAVGEAVIFFDRELSREFDYRCKQAGQLCSKMRFLSAQWVGMLRSGAWLRYGEQANSRARELAGRLERIPGVRIVAPVQANAVFAEMPACAVDRLRAAGWHFYTFIGSAGCRFMCSWETSSSDVEALAEAVRAAINEQSHRQK